MDCMGNIRGYIQQYLCDDHSYVDTAFSLRNNVGYY